MAKNASASAALLPETGVEPLASGMAWAGLFAVMFAVAMAMAFLREKKGKAKPSAQQRNVATGVSDARKEKGARAKAAKAEAEARMKQLKQSLERETKEKQGLSEENNFLKSALEERKATVQMFTSELQVRALFYLFVLFPVHILL
jgi:hypothetical protein